MTGLNLQRLHLLRKLQHEVVQKHTYYQKYLDLNRRIRTLKRSFVKSQLQNKYMWIFEYLKFLNNRGLFYDWIQKSNTYNVYDKFDGNYEYVSKPIGCYKSTFKKYLELNEKDVSIKILYYGSPSWQHNIFMIYKDTVEVKIDGKKLDISLYYLPHYNCYELGGILYTDDNKKVFSVIDKIDDELLVQTCRYRKAMKTLNKYIPALVQEFLWTPIYPSGRIGFHARKTWDLCESELKAMSSNKWSG